MNKYLLATITLSLILMGTIVYDNFYNPYTPSTTVDARIAPEVIKEATQPLEVKSIQVYKPDVKTKLKLPQEVVANPKKHVVAATKVKADDRAHTITTTVDQSDGKFTTYDRVDPLPWIGTTNRTHIGMYYGFKDTGQVVRIQVQQELIQLKALHVEAVASVDTGYGKPDAFIGIGGRLSF